MRWPAGTGPHCDVDSPWTGGQGAAPATQLKKQTLCMRLTHSVKTRVLSPHHGHEQNEENRHLVTVQITGSGSLFQSGPVGLGAAAPGGQDGSEPASAWPHSPVVAPRLPLVSGLLEIWKIEKHPLPHVFFDHCRIPKSSRMSLGRHLMP